VIARRGVAGSACILLFAVSCGGRLALTDEPIAEAEAPESSTLPTRDAATPREAGEDACVEAIGEEVTSHSCVHGTEGPFETVVLTPSPAGAPDASKLHVAYVLTVPAAKGEGYVAFVPSRAGDHVLYTSRAGVVAVENVNGVALAPIHRQRVTDCASFNDAVVFAFEEGKSYRVRIRTEEPKALLFFEHMGSFGVPWKRRCGDR